MYTLRPHRLIKPRKYQRGNIVVGVGLPPQGEIPPVLGSPGPGWSLIEEWDVGDLPFIEGVSAFNGIGCGDMLAWSPDGTRLTLSSTSQDTTRTFNIPTPFDPSTANAVLGQLNVLNVSNGKFDNAGSKFFIIHTVGDEISHYGATAHVINNLGPELSDITKAEAGFTSSTDGQFTFNGDGSILMWTGRNGGHRWQSFSVPNGDLDAFVSLADVTAPVSTSFAGLSPMNKDGDFWIRCLGSPGVAFETVDDLATMGNAASGASQSLAALTQIDMRPDHCWFNPLDTREIWFCDEETTGVQISRFATNVPTF